MQLAVDVQFPESFGGLEGEAVYIGASDGAHKHTRSPNVKH